METYIVRICRRHEKGENPAFAGIVEEVGKERKRRFADSNKLLKILKLDKGLKQKEKSSTRKSPL